MKWIIFLLLLISSFASSAQTVYTTGLTRYTVATTGGTAVDTTYEARTPGIFVNIPYDITRPNKAIDVAQSMTFNMNNIIVGRGGKVQFTIEAGSPILTLNGQVNFTVPSTAGVYIFRYSNIGGIAEWDYP